MPHYTATSAMKNLKYIFIWNININLYFLLNNLLYKKLFLKFRRQEHYLKVV